MIKEIIEKLKNNFQKKYYACIIARKGLSRGSEAYVAICYKKGDVFKNLSTGEVYLTSHFMCHLKDGDSYVHSDIEIEEKDIKKFSTLTPNELYDIIITDDTISV